jgi:glycosyltransferase involved in cell wall biosynthesis
MKILVVHEVNYLSKIIYEFQILPEILSMLGHEVTIVDYDDTWQSGNGSRWALRTTEHAKVHRAYESAAVTVRRPGMIHVPVLSIISGAITSGIEVNRLLRDSKVDVVMLYGLPTVGLQTIFASRRHGVPIVFRSIDVSHELVPYRVLVPPTRFLERIVYNRVDLNIVLTPHIRDYIQSYGVPESKIRLLPSGVDLEMFSAGPRDEAFLSKWKIGPRDPVILFMGTLYRFSGLDRVIRDFGRLLARHPSAKLLIVGAGEDEARLRSMASSGVVFAGMQPYSLLPDIIRSCDICINPFELNGVTERILPTKLFQYLACAKPVVATKLPGTLPFLKGEEDGVVYATHDDFVETVSSLLSDPARRAALGKAGAQAAQQYDWKGIAGQMVEWLSELISREAISQRK